MAQVDVENVLAHRHARQPAAVRSPGGGFGDSVGARPPALQRRPGRDRTRDERSSAGLRPWRPDAATGRSSGPAGSAHLGRCRTDPDREPRREAGSRSPRRVVRRRRSRIGAGPLRCGPVFLPAARIARRSEAPRSRCRAGPAGARRSGGLRRLRPTGATAPAGAGDARRLRPSGTLRRQHVAAAGAVARVNAGPVPVA